jgi:nicotinamide-nucleotide amidase
VGDHETAQAVIDLCREHGWTLATAESCTGGLVGAALTTLAGASDVYVGGVIAYSNDVKRSQLGIPDETLRAHGAVSAETAVSMAAGARRALDADVAVSVTGVAGPGGGSPDKPVGLVYITVSSPDGDATEKLQLDGDRERIRTDATSAALQLLHRHLTQGSTNARE